MSEACRFEPQILHAAQEDRWTEALRAHLGECDHCVAAMSVAPLMGRFARMGDREHMLPDPSIVWLKAKLLQSTTEVNRASRPLNLMQMVAYTIVAAGWTTVLLWKWEAIERWLNSFTPSGMVASAARAETLSLSFFAVVFVLASMTVMLAMHTILAEE